jgi:hypothetical protein
MSKKTINENVLPQEPVLLRDEEVFPLPAAEEPEAPTQYFYTQMRATLCAYSTCKANR